MNDIQKRNNQTIEKQFPGCLGRVVNLFDISAGVASNRLLTDKLHNHGLQISRSLSDIATTLGPLSGGQVDDEKMVLGFHRTSSNSKSYGTPMKMLIAQEMSKEIQSKHGPPNLVAKLMGLDALPCQQPHAITQKSLSNSSLQHGLSHMQMSAEYWKYGHLDCQEYAEVKDVHEVWQQPERINSLRVKSPHKGRCGDVANEKKMALVRQKFVEAKRLATDENLRQSKEFQDALEFLSSNKDLLLKFLQEPNSMFSKHPYDLPAITTPETKRITILRPSKAIDDDKFSLPLKKGENLIKISTQATQESFEKVISGHSSTYITEDADEYSSQPTRIVVLKPTTGKIHNIKAVVSPPPGSPRIFGEIFFGKMKDDAVLESREGSKDTRLMHENLADHGRDETLVSSVFSNGYTGDDSSFNHSENDFAVGNVSESEVVSPTSRHSWDYINKYDSPDSASSFSRASCSPESSVCREAKKRLSERWALMAMNQRSQEQKHFRKGSNTLGEMLTLSDSKRSGTVEDDGLTKEQEPMGATSSLASSSGRIGPAADSPTNLLRSKSVPVSSTVNNDQLNVHSLNPESVRSNVPKEQTRKTNTKSSLKEKVSSLFFSRNRKSSKEKSGASQSKDELQATSAESSVSSETPPGKVGLSVPNPAALEILNQLDQPSPISVLEPTFEEDENTTLESSEKPVHVHPKSNLIDKSPPIGSLARTLSWDDSCLERASSYQLKSPIVCPGTVEDKEEEDWLLFVEKLLLAAGLGGEVQSKTFILGLRSPECPLDPSLRDKFATLNEKEPLPEAKRRQRRSNRKLAFDCINAAIVEILGRGSECNPMDRTCGGVQDWIFEGTLSISVDQVWDQMKEWFTNEVSCDSRDNGDINCLVVDSVVRNEVVGKGWVEHLRLEMHILGEEIEGKLLEELVDEAVVDLTGTD